MRAVRTIRAALGICSAALLLSRPAHAAPGEFPPLNDPPTRERLPGKFVWADLFTTDPAMVAKFYQEMFGWSSTVFPRDGRVYHLLSREGRPVAGIVQRPAARATGAPARWIGYIAVADIDDVLERALVAGGKILAPKRDVPRRGIQAIVTDNEGAVVGLLQSNTGDTADYRPEPGEWIWAELFVSRPDAAVTFYQRVFGYAPSAEDPPETNERFVLAAGGFARAGIAPLPRKEEAQAAWLGFVRVASVDDTVRRAAALGGRVVVSPRASRAGGRFAIVSDPAGAAVGVVELAATEPEKASP